jgi:hypothetical protein
MLRRSPRWEPYALTRSYGSVGRRLATDVPASFGPSGQNQLGLRIGACNNCHFRSFLERVTNSGVYTCGFCGISKGEDGLFCDVCETMGVAVTRPFFVKAQQEYLEENRKRIRAKERLLHGEDIEPYAGP